LKGNLNSLQELVCPSLSIYLSLILLISRKSNAIKSFYLKKKRREQKESLFHGVSKCSLDGTLIFISEFNTLRMGDFKNDNTSETSDNFL